MTEHMLPWPKPPELVERQLDLIAAEDDEEAPTVGAPGIALVADEVLQHRERGRGAVGGDVFGRAQQGRRIGEVRHLGEEASHLQPRRLAVEAVQVELALDRVLTAAQLAQHRVLHAVHAVEQGVAGFQALGVRVQQQFAQHLALVGLGLARPRRHRRARDAQALAVLAALDPGHCGAEQRGVVLVVWGIGHGSGVKQKGRLG